MESRKRMIDRYTGTVSSDIGKCRPVAADHVEDLKAILRLLGCHYFDDVTFLEDIDWLLMPPKNNKPDYLKSVMFGTKNHTFLDTEIFTELIQRQR